MKRTLLVASVAVVFCVAMAGTASAQGVLFVQGEKVGINTGATDPAAPLEVIGTPATVGTGNSVTLLKNAGPLAFQLDDTTVAGFWNFSNALNEAEFRISKSGTGGVELTVDSSGNVKARGSFVSGGTTLNVPDYVFASDYELMPLGELASFVKNEGHLPNVPSAGEVQKSGLNITDMQLTLLEKVEELTLYTLAQQEKIEQLEANLAELSK